MDELESFREIAQDPYFDAVEVTHFEQDEVRDQVKALLEQAHLEVGYGAQPCLLSAGLNPNDTDEAGRKAAEELLVSRLDEAYALGAKSFAIMAGKWKEETRELAYSQLLKTVRTVCRRAAEKGMLVELEVFDYDVDKCALIGPASYAARFAADVRMTEPNFGLMVDLSHIPIMHESTEYVIRILRPYITHLHCGNAVALPGCPAYGDLHPRFGYPNGAIDVPEIVKYLQTLRDEGCFYPDHPLVFSFEVKPQKGESERAVLAGCKRALNRAWALLED